MPQWLNKGALSELTMSAGRLLGCLCAILDDSGSLASGGSLATADFEQLNAIHMEVRGFESCVRFGLFPETDSEGPPEEAISRHSESLSFVGEIAALTNSATKLSKLTLDLYNVANSQGKKVLVSYSEALETAAILKRVTYGVPACFEKVKWHMKQALENHKKKTAGMAGGGSVGSGHAVRTSGRLCTIGRLRAKPRLRLTTFEPNRVVEYYWLKPAVRCARAYASNAVAREHCEIRRKPCRRRLTSKK
jgi:hypothetical protein